MNTNKWKHFLLLSKVFFWNFQYSPSGWETNGFSSGVEKREEVDNVAPSAISFTAAQYPVGWSLIFVGSQAGSYHMMPRLFLYFSGVGGRRKAKLGSDRTLSPLNYSLTHTCMDMRNASHKWMFLCRKGSLLGSKTETSASKIHTSKNYGLSFIT